MSMPANWSSPALKAGVQGFNGRSVYQVRHGMHATRHSRATHAISLSATPTCLTTAIRFDQSLPPLPAAGSAPPPVVVDPVTLKVSVESTRSGVGPFGESRTSPFGPVIGASSSLALTASVMRLPLPLRPPLRPAAAPSPPFAFADAFASADAFADASADGVDGWVGGTVETYLMMSVASGSPLATKWRRPPDIVLCDILGFVGRELGGGERP
mmetsp:Transcript_61428/g.168685  ORF Transcript_61428/g.168685 Transcript_61428/m.168685 type:complete len:213 (-) Transcript_61428:80-718(-)